MNRSLSNNSVFQVSNRLGEYFLVSIYWILCSLPVLTIGTATMALYDTVARSIGKNEGTVTKRFFGTFKRELLRGVLLTVLTFAAAAALGMGYSVIYQTGQTSKAWGIFSIIYLITLFVPLGTLCWALAIESRFVYGFGELLKIAFTFTVFYLPYTAAIVAILLAGGLAVFFAPLTVIAIPAITAHLQSIFIEKVFAKYIPEES